MLEHEVVIGGRFYLAGGNIVHNIARFYQDSWSSYGGGLTSSDDLAEVHDLAIDNHTGDVYACGSFTEADGSLSLNNIAKWSNETQSWTRVAATDLSRPEGQLFKIILLETKLVNPNHRPDYGQYRIAGIAVAIVVFIIGAILLVAFLIWKIRNRNPYEGYKPIVSPISLTELEQDKDIKRIDINKLEMGERIAIGASGEGTFISLGFLFLILIISTPKLINFLQIQSLREIIAELKWLSKELCFNNQKGKLTIFSEKLK